MSRPSPRPLLVAAAVALLGAPACTRYHEEVIVPGCSPRERAPARPDAAPAPDGVLAGRIVAEDGTPLGRATVELATAEGAWRAVPVDSLGRFWLRGVGGARYVTRVRHMGLSPRTDTLVLPANGAGLALALPMQYPMCGDIVGILRHPIPWWKWW